MTIALTGASGNLGRLAIAELLATGTPASEIVAIVRTPSKVADLAEQGVLVRQASYGDVPALTAALQGVDRLLLVSVSGPGASQAHASVIEAAEAAGVQHITYTSILNADTSAQPLAPEHAATERLLAASSIPATILRNAWYHELYTRLMEQYLATGEVVGSVGDAPISGAARVDLAAAAAHVLASDDDTPCTHELGGTPFTFDDLARTITEVSGKPIVHRRLTDEQYTAELVAQGIDEGFAGWLVGSDASIRQGDMHTDSTALADLLGRPLTPLADSVRAAL